MRYKNSNNCPHFLIQQRLAASWVLQEAYPEKVFQYKMLIQECPWAKACRREGLLQDWAKGEVQLQCRPTGSLGWLHRALELESSRVEMRWPGPRTTATSHWM